MLAKPTAVTISKYMQIKAFCTHNLIELRMSIISQEKPVESTKH